ncbi:MAG: ubiquinone biosynthesis protein COQ4 [Caulobacteraceae bacterium]|nr:ubiquinone biosynthesis protein COQ4 [Caulobacteraceae bacterium]
MKDKEDTAQVFEITSALAGRSSPRGYQRMLRDREGARQAYLGAELVDRLRDEAWLAGFADGTVGAAYRAFLQRNGFNADGLVEVSAQGSAPPIPHPTAWYGRRVRDIHDIWHVLTGYETDALGEACIVGFSYAQTGSLGFAAIGLGAAREIEREDRGVPALRAVLEGWRNGRKAAWLPALDYEALFAEPLEAARERLGIRPPRIYDSVPESRRRALRLRNQAAG